jgi:hypothetical protein
MTFKDENRLLQEMVRELLLLRDHNLKIKPGESQEKLMLVAEAGLVLMVLERFLRIIPGVNPAEKDTLPNLLEKATSKRLQLLVLDDRENAIKRITRVRNTIIHANYEQAMKDYGLAHINEYFKIYFASEIEVLTKITDELLKQIDPNTGKRISNS